VNCIGAGVNNGTSHAVGIQSRSSWQRCHNKLRNKPRDDKRAMGSVVKAKWRTGSGTDPASAPSAPVRACSAAAAGRFLTLEERGVELSSDTLHLGPDDGGMVFQTSGVV
jgi:hypothetical protein